MQRIQASHLIVAGAVKGPQGVQGGANYDRQHRCSVRGFVEVAQRRYSGPTEAQPGPMGRVTREGLLSQ